ncbi:MAG: hypothetical protein C0602_03165 [Denitrovibrio sp.]|nr:MAG: hypothetical protein C0602_03165 [Denitrovibrio sp.]
MSKNNFIQMYDNTIKKAEIVLNAPYDDNFMKLYEAYSSSLKQLTQVMKTLDDKQKVSEETKHILDVHKKVEDKLLAEKEGLFKKIRSTICREHIRHKYYSKSIKSSLVDRKS